MDFILSVLLDFDVILTVAFLELFDGWMVKRTALVLQTNCPLPQISWHKFRLTVLANAERIAGIPSEITGEGFHLRLLGRDSI